MKKLFSLFCTALLFQVVNAQTLPTDPETKKITYSEAVSLDSLKKDVLFDRSKHWVITKSEDKKPETADLEKGEVTDNISFLVKLTYDIKYKKDANVSFTITLNQKDGKYKYKLDNFRIYDVKSGVKTQEPLEAYLAKQRQNSKTELVTQVDKEVKALMEDLKKLMEKGEQEKKEDW
jgi:hypothetical protein